MGLSFKQKYSFGIGALGKDLCYAVVSYYLMVYFTDSIGLAPLFVGNLFLVARLWDAVNDPMMGMVVDNTRSRWGKFRPWIFIGTVLNAIVLIFLFKKPAGLEGTSLNAYYSVMYILWGMTYTVMDIPYWSMLPSLSKTPEERAKMSVIPRIFASLAWLIMGGFGLAAVNFFGKGDVTKGYEGLATAIAIVFVITTVITVVNVKDSSSKLAAAKKKKGEGTSVKKAIKLITQNDQLLVFIGVVLAYNLVAQISGGMAIYYFKYVVGNENLYPVFTAFAGLAEIAGLVLFPILSKMLSKKAVFGLACFLPAIGLVLLLIAGFILPQNALLVALSGIILKLGSGFTLGATTVMLADIIDYGQVKFGSRNESIIASFQTLLVKTASAVAAWLIGVGLTIVGYVPNVAQTGTTLLGMRVIMIAIPSIITILGFIIYCKGYKLHGEYQEKIMDELERINKENAAVNL